MKRTAIITIILSLSLTFSTSQSINKLVKYGDNKEMLLGKINKSGLQNQPFAIWFNKNHDDYIVNKDLVTTFSKNLKNYTIKAFLGTWCGDSKLEVPRFYSVLETANFPMDQLKVVALDRSDDAYKQSPNGEERGMDIHRVPTFIFFKEGKEVNRIVEHPKETFERDIKKIVTGERYKFNYLAANYVQLLLKEKTIDTLQKDEANIVPTLSEFVKGSRELNTLGYVLLRHKHIDKAMYVFDLNTKIFPYKHNVFKSMAEAYFITKNCTKALKNYYKVLSLKPEDKNALLMVEKIKALQSIK